jgi:hypothetical protein
LISGRRPDMTRPSATFRLLLAPKDVRLALDARLALAKVALGRSRLELTTAHVPGACAAGG